MTTVDDTFRTENVVAAIDPTPREAAIAGCPGCRVPLISTFAFSGAEFYCLDCGGLFGFMAPVRLESTAENDAALARYEAEWKDLGGPKLLGGGVMLRACETCREKGEPHLAHASTEEQRAHSDALVAIAARAGR